MGIQITKLDGEKGPDRAPGQGTLSFSKKRTLNGGIKAETPQPLSRDLEDDESRVKDEAPPVETVEDDAGDRSPTHSLPRSDPSPSPPPPPKDALPAIPRNASAGPSRPPLGISTSSDGIDPDFLAALPEELRREVKQDFARTRAASKPIAPAKLPTPPPRPSTTPSRHGNPVQEEETTPTKAKGKHHAAHITRQLRPKVKTQLKAAAVAELPLYSAWARAEAQDEIVDLTGPSAEDEQIGEYSVGELKDLGIDPAVFRELPEDLQKDVVETERAKYKKRKILHRPADTSRFRARERFEARTTSRSPSRSRADSAPPTGPRIAITRPTKPTLLKATSLEDVKDTVTRWITSRKAGPAAKDSRKVKEYIVKSMAPSAGTGGIEMAIEVLRWMRVVVEDRWGAPNELYDEKGEQGKKAREEWWNTWTEFVREVDKISKERFGAGIRL